VSKFFSIRCLRLRPLMCMFGGVEQKHSDNEGDNTGFREAVKLFLNT